jgi:Mn2+/Fe2+ NRAMP family transporter
LATREHRVMAEMTNRRLTNVTMLLITVTITGLNTYLLVDTLF